MKDYPHVPFSQTLTCEDQALKCAFVSHQTPKEGESGVRGNQAGESKILADDSTPWKEWKASNLE